MNRTLFGIVIAGLLAMTALAGCSDSSEEKMCRPGLHACQENEKHPPVVDVHGCEATNQEGKGCAELFEQIMQDGCNKGQPYNNGTDVLCSEERGPYPGPDPAITAMRLDIEDLQAQIAALEAQLDVLNNNTCVDGAPNGYGGPSCEVPPAPGGHVAMPIILKPGVGCVLHNNTMLYAPSNGAEWFVWTGNNAIIYADYETETGYEQKQFEWWRQTDGAIAWQPVGIHGKEFCFVQRSSYLDEPVTIYVSLVPSASG